MNALQFLQSQSGYYDRVDTDQFDFPVLIPRFLSYGDYDNSCMVERANFKTFLEEFGDSPWVYTVSGYYGYEAIAIHPNGLKVKEISETLAALESYPVLDDELLSAMEWDAYQTDWEDYGRKDFIDLLVKEFDLSDRLEEMLEDLESEPIQEFFESLIPSGDFFIIESGGICYIRLRESVKNCDRDRLAKFLKSIR
jgi:hypothetical protein